MNSLIQLINAIESQHVIEFEYVREDKSAGKRVGHPYALFIHTSLQGAQSVKLHLLQVEGVSDSKEKSPLPDFRMFNFEDIHQVELTDEYFVADSPKFNPAWEGYAHVIAQVKNFTLTTYQQLVFEDALKLYANANISEQKQFSVQFYGLDQHNRPIGSLELNLLEARALYDFLRKQFATFPYNNAEEMANAFPPYLQLLSELLEKREPEAIPFLLQFFSVQEREQYLLQSLATAELSNLYQKSQQEHRQQGITTLQQLVKAKEVLPTQLRDWLFDHTWILGKKLVKPYDDSLLRTLDLPATTVVLESPEKQLASFVFPTVTNQSSLAISLGESRLAYEQLRFHYPNYRVQVYVVLPDASIPAYMVENTASADQAVQLVTYTQLVTMASDMHAWM